MGPRSAGTDRSVFDRDWWIRARTVPERRAAADRSSPSPSHDPDLAARRLERWRESFGDEGDGAFGERLAADGWTTESLSWILGEPADAFRGGGRASRPSWLTGLERVYGPTLSGAAGGWTPDPDRPLGLVAPAEPLADAALQRLEAEARRLGGLDPTAPFDPADVPRLFRPALERRLSVFLHLVLTLELNVARLRGQLRGDSEQDRYHSFLDRVGRPEGLLPLMEEYPLLWRRLWTVSRQWVRSTGELLAHLVEDHGRIREELFDGRDPGTLSEVRIGAGDRHRGGRSVAILTFDGGRRLVYKPRSLAVDRAFGAYVGWLNRRGQSPELRAARIVDAGDHGWTEFVRPEACADTEQVRRFYRRQGAYLAVFYALEAMDLHYENLVASGEHPVVVDLECLLAHRRPRRFGQDVPGSWVAHLLGRSVSRTGLLPKRVWGRPRREGLEISGLGGESGQQMPFPMWNLEARSTDRMRAVLKHGTMTGAENRPVLADEPARVLDYLDDLVEGFRDTYRLVVDTREAWLEGDGGPGTAGAFADVRVRSVLRPTAYYSLVLTNMHHPDLLRDAVEVDLLLEHLWAGLAPGDELARLVPFERRDLLRGDVPVFYALPGSRDLFASDGERIPEFFSEPSLDSVERHVRSMGPEDLERQVWVIRSSMNTLSREREPAPDGRGASTRAGREARGGWSPEEAVEEAGRIGDRLERLCFRHDGHVGWAGVTLTGEREWSLQPLGFDLYNGIGGVALFLAYLAEVTGERRHRELAREALSSCLDFHRGMAVSPGPGPGIGAFTGLSGLSYLLAHLGRLWDDPGLRERATSIAGECRDLAADDDDLDVIGGSAGAILALAAVHETVPGGESLELVRRCADRLLDRATETVAGIGWKTPAEESRPLAGFSHGGAGFALALARARAILGEERYGEAAVGALEHERSLYVAEHANWPDLRDPPDGREPRPGDAFMWAWCHGAPGIGLGRVATLDHLPGLRPSILEEIRAAVDSTVRTGFASNLSLCHGALGNLELLLAVHRRVPELAVQEELADGRDQVARVLARDGWRCGVPISVDTPGLMMGLAGIGYGLLRQAAPDRVPSLLLLEPPRPSGERSTPEGVRSDAEGARR